MWFEPVSTLDLIIKGLLIGVVASAPMGPVGVLCIQRTLNKGRWYGFVTENKDNMFLLQVAGSIMLFFFGWYTYRCNPAKSIRPTSPRKGTLIHNMVTGFLVTFSNPLIIFLFVALFARFTFVVPDHVVQQSLGYLSILVGAMIWWFVLTYFIDKVRSRFDVKGIYLLNRLIGVVVIVASIVGFAVTLTGLSL